MITRGTGQAPRSRQSPACRALDDRPPPRPGAGYPDLSQEQQGKEDHHNPDPELKVLRVRSFDHLDARHDADEGRDQEREHQPRLGLPPRVPYHHRVDEY